MIKNVFEWIGDNSVALLAIWGSLCIVIDGITGLTASKKDDALWAKIKTILGKIFSLRPTK